MNKKHITREDIEKMSNAEIDSLLKSCSVDDLVELNSSLFGADSPVSKSIKSWRNSGSYSETKLKNMIIHVCTNNIKSIKQDYENAELERKEKERKKSFAAKVVNKFKNKNKGEESMLTKKEVERVNSIINESMNDGIIDNETCEVLTELVESCSEFEGLTDDVLEMVEEFIKTEDVVDSEENHVEEVEESVESITDLKLAVYEACKYGTISTEDRDEYLAMLEAAEKETKSEKEEKIEELSDEKKTLKTVADIDKNESKINKIKKEIEDKEEK